MSEQKILRFYLEDSLRQSAQAGTHNFIRQVSTVAKSAGLEVEYHGDSLADRAASMARDGYALFHMQEPTTPNGMTFRRVYHYPFWAIEPTGKRWDWRVAKTRFDADEIDPNKAKTFFERWQKHLFHDAPKQTMHDGFIYVPLQGRLLERRSFQLCSPVEMILSVLQHDPNRQVIATLHPGEQYSREEQKRLEQLQSRFSHLTIRSGGMVELLHSCDYVVTQNSAAAFNGFFFQKPCVLFAKSDFHHISASVGHVGVAAAFDMVRRMQPDYARYLFWFWQMMSINAGRKEAETKIATALRRAGWPI
ncbi:hypothetical protein [Thalassovita sp.]|uniref:hypothetical protein n=1 Tax=Thalassovita sp. TaxID=1979401 RepID=UPI0028816D21|nr:hypothetical protein [Thalassovita sp.]MDF1802174.1 hypothetical protein [Thalassovita sp.]